MGRERLRPGFDLDLVSPCSPPIVPGLEVADGGVTIVRDHKGRNSGKAYVQFTSQDMADQALDRDRGFMGHRWAAVMLPVVEQAQPTAHGSRI